jgi:K+-transporting ATPase ATPase C chain
MNPLVSSDALTAAETIGSETSTLAQVLQRGVVAFVLLAVVCCGVYPLATWALGQGLFPGNANGTLIVDSQGRVRGSYRIGQSFRSPRYFHSRPSAAGTDGYDGGSSAGSNLGPTSAQLRQLVSDRVTAYRLENRLDPAILIPVDAVTASGSGLDPWISLRNAELQGARVSRERGMPQEQVLELVQRHMEKRQWGIFGEPGVSVVRLNLALDAIN